MHRFLKKTDAVLADNKAYEADVLMQDKLKDNWIGKDSSWHSSYTTTQ